MTPPPPALDASRLAARVEHTLLAPGATPLEVDRLCDEAAELELLAVCVAPSFVARAARRLDGGPVLVVSVAGFPLGHTTSEVKAEEAARAFGDGAREVDVVQHVGLLRAGEDARVVADLSAVVARRPPGCRIKVILETALLDEEQKRRAARLAAAAGADFVKTSTGFGPGGATVADVALLRAEVGAALGVKAAGGIRDLGLAEALVAAGADRLGTSAGAALVAQARARAPRRPDRR